MQHQKFVMKFSCVILFVLMIGQAGAQDVPRFKPQRNRILFLLDGSGSMKEQWQNTNRFEVAKRILFNIIDSVERKNPNVEFAVRVFGHQSPREQKNCTDSKLLIPFAKNNAAKVKTMMPSLSPKGMTPIAYSISQAVNDFPVDEKSLNSIILITDGNENCNGNPCEVAAVLISKRITLKPFIVGLDMQPDFAKKFDCVGTFYNPKDESSIYGTVGVIIQQTLNTTTTQINLLDHNGNPTVTNIPFTLYDNTSQKIMYNFVHILDAKGNPDTIYLDPVGLYDIEVHSTPSVRKNSIELTPGKHNIIAIDVPVGSLTFTGTAAADAPDVVRKGSDILVVQNTGEGKMLLKDVYRAEVLTLPQTFFDETPVMGGVKNEKAIKSFGTLSLVVSEPLSLSVLEEKNDVLTLVTRMDLRESTTLKLQPGNFILVYKPAKSSKTESTKAVKVLLEESRYQVVSLK